jgi:RNA polymerase sigma-70 factor (ECF subfamily)
MEVVAAGYGLFGSLGAAGRLNVHSDARMEDRAELALIARAKAGDRDAYERLLEPTIRSATRLAFAMLHDRSEAEDVFQESALRAWRRLGNLRDGRRFQPWFIGIVANQCREVRRSKWWKLVRLPDVRTMQSVDETAWLEGEDLRRAIQELPYDQRAAVLLHFHLDMPLSDVALALGISVAGVKTRVNRALKRLRPAMGVSEATANG